MKIEQNQTSKSQKPISYWIGRGLWLTTTTSSAVDKQSKSGYCWEKKQEKGNTLDMEMVWMCAEEEQ